MRPEQPGPLTRSALRGIERHRRSRLANAGVCRFEPSCSHYAEEVLRSRTFVVAAVLTAWRLLRCNPLAVRPAADPARRSRRWRARANSIPTLFSILALSGFVFLATEGIANAVGVAGGCTATVNGADPASLTRDNPLVVHKHESVQFVGNVPPSVAAASGGHLNSNTHIDVDLVEGLGGISSSDHPGTGVQWGGSQAIDAYLKYGVGLYHVSGVATGDGGWTCTGDAYVQLEDGSPLSHPVGEVATGVAAVGALGAAFAGQSSPSADFFREMEDIQRKDEEHDRERDAKTGLKQVIDAPTTAGSAIGCLGLLFLLIYGTKAVDAALASAAFAAATPGKRRVWARGHAIVGTISGLFLGLGLAVLLQQYAFWPLTIATAFVFPGLVAIVCGIRAYIGTPYKVVTKD